jgi:hypothetical protein
MRDYDAIGDPNVSAATPKAVILRTSQPTSEFAPEAAFHDATGSGWSAEKPKNPATHSIPARHRPV